MNQKSTAQRLLDTRQGKERKRGPYPLVGILVLALIILGSESDEMIPWGMLFLGLSVGGLIVEVRWRKNGRFFWGHMSDYIDWSKVEEDANEDSNQSAQDNPVTPPENPRTP